MALFKGEARKYSIAITDGNGAAVDPATLDDVRIWIYDQSTGTVYAKWAVVTATDYGTATIDGNNVVFYLDDDDTADIEEGRAVIQITIYDTYAGGQDMICTKKGVFAVTKDAQV
jgi:hypothetical protein